MTTSVKYAVAAALAAGFAAGAFAKVQTWGDEKYRPRLFKRFGDVVNLPDGLTQDRDGNIFMSLFLSSSKKSVVYYNIQERKTQT